MAKRMKGTEYRDTAEWARAVIGARAAVLRRQLARLERHPGAEVIHDVRVAARRLRAALRHFGPCLPARPAERLNGAVRAVARLLGAARDADVVLENMPRGRLPARSVLPAVRARLARERQRSVERGAARARRLRDQLPTLAAALFR